MHSLASVFPYYIALSRGIAPRELGLGEDTAYVQCVDPCERTGGGTVVFRIRRVGHDRAAEGGRAKAE